MKTIGKTVGMYGIGVLLYLVLLMMLVITTGQSPYLPIIIYNITPLTIITFVSITSLYMVEELVGEDELEISISELVKKMALTAILTFIIGTIIQYIAISNTNIMNQSPVETTVFIVNLAYVIPYGLISWNMYKDIFNNIGIEKGKLSEYVAFTMLMIMSILMLQSLTKWAFISSIVIFIVVCILAYLLTKENKGEGLTEDNDSGYTESEIVN